MKKLPEKWLGLMKFKGKLEQIKHDEEQYLAYKTNSNTVVLAGPGSGKTTVLTLKIMKLLRDNICSPRGLACVTYSREAAREFTDRLIEYGFSRRKNVFLGTMHSFCIAEVIKPFAHLFPKYQIPLPIKIVSEGFRNKLFKRVIKDLKLETVDLKIEQMDKERKLSIPGQSKVEIEIFDVALRVGVEYEKQLHSKGYMDYEDVVKFATILIQKEDYVRRCIEAKFPWMLIDEYQDLGKPLHEMILSLLEQTQIKFFAVGDPDQSIYSFQGAIPEYLIELSELPRFQKIQLTTNYRSNQGIIDASEVVLGNKKNYKAGNRIGEEAQFSFVVCDVGIEQQFCAIIEKVIPEFLSQGIRHEEIALLVGFKADLKSLSEHMEKAGIPYYVPRNQFDRTEIVRWLEECAKWVLEAEGASLTRLHNFWVRLLVTHQKISGSRMEQLEEKIRLRVILTESRKYKNSIFSWLTNVYSELGLAGILNNSTLYPDEIDNLAELFKAAEEPVFENYDLSRFTKLGKPEGQVTLTTRHSSKGLEFEAVIILGLEEGRFPFYKKIGNEKELQEEYRVFFVCVSRAKMACCLARSKSVLLNGRYGSYIRPQEPSRFWDLFYKNYGHKANTLYYT